MRFNVIGGLPRAGSTLLCNILNQNPKIYASSTSCLPQLINAISNVWSTSPELKSLLEKNPKETNDRMNNSLKAFIETWYSDKDMVFDKGRGWGHLISVLNNLFPDSKALICIRDLRNVFASIEKQNAKMPILDTAKNPLEKTQYSRADNMFSPQGIIGMPINGIEDILRRDNKNVLFIKYEEFIEEPAIGMERIYKFINEDFYKHDFDNIKNTAIDLDYGHYLGKYPHQGNGKIKITDKKEWTQYISNDIANNIMGRYPMYNQKFGYI